MFQTAAPVNKVRSLRSRCRLLSNGRVNGNRDVIKRCSKQSYQSTIIIGGSCHKYNFCRDKTFVATNTCIKHVFVATKHVCYHDKRVRLSRHNNFCCDKIIFVATKYFCRDKYVFVATKVLLRQEYFCRHKSKLVTTKLLSDKNDTCGSCRQ